MSSLQETPGVITFAGTPMTLLGQTVAVGETAPDFVALANDLSPRSLASYAGKVLILNVVPSLDTGICDAQTRRFNQEAANLGQDVRILTLSCDLPFAQARWCGAAGIDQVETLSDYRETSFGLAYGLLIKELRLLTRAVLVVNKNGVIVHQEIVPEIKSEVNFAAALAAAKEAV